MTNSTLAEIEQATSGMIAQERGISDLAANELVYDVPHARTMRPLRMLPQQPNRFNGPNRGHGAALDVETCLAEVGFHLTNALADAGDATVGHAEMFCSLAVSSLICQRQTISTRVDKAAPIGRMRWRQNSCVGPQWHHLSIGESPVASASSLRPAAIQAVRQAQSTG